MYGVLSGQNAAACCKRRDLNDVDGAIQARVSELRTSGFLFLVPR